MKFGKEYQDALIKGEFPAQWVHSAISYGQLKKCIKKVREELQEIGLDADTLAHLLRACSIDEAQVAPHSAEQSFQYRFSPEIHAKTTPRQDSSEESDSPEIFQGFRPKLLFAVDEESGEPVDAYLSPDTKEYLHQLAVSQRLTDIRITELPGPSIPVEDGHASPQNGAEQTASPQIRMVEVPLSSDGIFFKRLRAELSGLERLQMEEKERLSADIRTMGKTLSKSTEPARTLSTHKSDLSVWREIFLLYMESEIFFSSHELDHGFRSPKQVQDKLESFSAELKRRDIESRLKRKDSKIALNQFLALNLDLFKNLRFQDIEYKAMRKILKKFDKRTALGISSKLIPSISPSVLSQGLARTICTEVSNELVTLVPQVSDYLCPVCMSLAWRPVRLSCHHVFCIRCLIVMQRNHDDHCPMCREPVVMQADSDNIDETMAKFLKKYFPEEVKAKHEDNVRQAGIDEYGEEFYSDKCAIM
ncbi:RING-14 protein [Viridothelium virens]|uniref:RING-14 protein n=1 Tax=Viridothelium virens TaxID=1048519 RepID=A0A6A6H886_VIRVR|nr:RING-14 protein [Viridothelium virens]